MSLSAGFKPVSLLATSHYTRAGPGGTGGFKLGANYAPGVVPQVEAAKEGYSQNLWLIGENHLLTEVGTMVRRAKRPRSVRSSLARLLTEPTLIFAEHVCRP
jgi:hypothetical protein